MAKDKGNYVSVVITRSDNVDDLYIIDIEILFKSRMDMFIRHLKNHLEKFVSENGNVSDWSTSD